ncbi:nitrate reductase molybdenum cofactor assembly chaperone [Streptomyces oryzae]|uniref:Nitrate reductase molybdenum cofactor assembly chaperone n=1 Tax=Streptomyces oryzae TaxID=1434886 RepID=A0ABS3XG23_9ACTN|nr:nitrate reductase molybdenum cofactor assembly chaperone [Streptomyces oryzae]MBO8193972.1 nitrate reductase molybdenum cofactor assembly chaperone [Streptomyces oryzae]
MSAPLVHQAAALLLDYPDGDWPDRLHTVRTVLEELPAARCPQAAGLLRFCSETAEVPVLELAARYVATFDRSRRRTLHLTYYTDGDTRRRGASLAALKAQLRQHGWAVRDGELPDFLPGLLEFAARCPEAGGRLLREHRAGLALLTEALEKYASPYARVLRAVLDTLPAPGPEERAAVHTLARGGPPGETVGLEPLPHPSVRPSARHPEGARR